MKSRQKMGLLCGNNEKKGNTVKPYGVTVFPFYYFPLFFFLKFGIMKANDRK